MMIGIVLSVIIGIAIGAVILYVVMDKRLDVLRVTLAKKETEVEMMKTTKEQLHDMGMLLANAQAQRLKEENKENLGSITQPLKDAITNMQKAIHENQKESAAHSASFREQMLQMMGAARGAAHRIPDIPACPRLLLGRM